MNELYIVDYYVFIIVHNSANSNIIHYSLFIIHYSLFIKIHEQNSRRHPLLHRHRRPGQ